ncbi:MAG: hypothetical protein U9R06_02265 [Patescibacteria group bacterium]|nr:hypothetical protein [Patescibacteria group bacterium]
MIIENFKAAEKIIKETKEKQELIDEIKKVKGDIPDWPLKKDDEGAEVLREAKLEGGIKEQISRAREIMGEREVMGYAEVKKAFGIEIAESELPQYRLMSRSLRKQKNWGSFWF